MTAATAATAGAVLLHPHPDHGGDQHNVVIEALWRTCATADVAAVRFDFASSDVATCVTQAVAALGELPEGVPRFLVGYSFGSIVASQVDDERVHGWVLVAPGGAHGVAPIALDERPKLVLLPEHDQFGRPELDGWSATTVEPVAGADHFLAGATTRVADRVVGWIRSSTAAS